MLVYKENFTSQEPRCLPLWSAHLLALSHRMGSKPSSAGHRQARHPVHMAEVALPARALRSPFLLRFDARPPSSPYDWQVLYSGVLTLSPSQRAYPFLSHRASSAGARRAAQWRAVSLFHLFEDTPATLIFTCCVGALLPAFNSSKMLESWKLHILELKSSLKNQILTCPRPRNNPG